MSAGSVGQFGTSRYCSPCALAPDVVASANASTATAPPITRRITSSASSVDRYCPPPGTGLRHHGFPKFTNGPSSTATDVATR